MSSHRMSHLPQQLHSSAQRHLFGVAHEGHDMFLIAMVLADIQSLSFGSYWIPLSISSICSPVSLKEMSPDVSDPSVLVGLQSLTVSRAKLPGADGVLYVGITQTTPLISKKPFSRTFSRGPNFSEPVSSSEFHLCGVAVRTCK